MPDVWSDIEGNSTPTPELRGDAERRARFEALYAANSASSDDAADAMAETFKVAWRRLDAVCRAR